MRRYRWRGAASWVGRGAWVAWVAWVACRGIRRFVGRGICTVDGALVGGFAFEGRVAWLEGGVGEAGLLLRGGRIGGPCGLVEGVVAGALRRLLACVCWLLRRVVVGVVFGCCGSSPF
jgi:hypothetical protein